MCLFYLLRENVLLVEEEHNGCGGEVAVIADAVEQVQALVHSVLRKAEAVGHQAAQVAAPWSLGSWDVGTSSLQALPDSLCFVGLSGYSGSTSLLKHSGPLGTYHFVVLHQHHVVSAQCRDENDAGHTLKAVDPLFALGSLPAYIEHSVGQSQVRIWTCVSGHSDMPTGTPCLPKLAGELSYGLASEVTSLSPGKGRPSLGTVKFRSGQLNMRAGVLPEVEVLEGELCLDDASGFDTRTQHVLLSGHIPWSHQTL